MTSAPVTEITTPHAGAVLLFASGATFLALMDATVVNVAFSDLRQSFPQVTIAGLSWIITAYAIMFAALLAASGQLADVLGRRRLFTASILGFTVASLAAAFAPSVAWLVIARIVQGTAAAGMIPAGLGLLLTYTPPVKRAAALGAWGAAGALAAAVGPGLGGLLVNVRSWRAVFIINVPLGLLILAGAVRRIPKDQPSGRRLPDPIGTTALVLAIACPVAALTQGTTWGWTSPKILALFAVTVVFAGVVAMRSTQSDAPVVEWDLWRSGTFKAANICAALFGAGFYAWLLACPVFLATVWHYSVLKSGLGITPGAFAAAFGAVLVGRRVPVDKQWIAVVFGSLLAGASFASMGLVIGQDPSYVVRWLPPGLLAGLGIGCVLTGLSTIASGVLPAPRFAAGTGMLMTSRQVGGAVGVAALAVILQRGGLLELDSYLTGFLWCGGVCLLAGISAVAMRGRTA